LFEGQQIGGWGLDELQRKRGICEKKTGLKYNILPLSTADAAKCGSRAARVHGEWKEKLDTASVVAMTSYQPNHLRPSQGWGGRSTFDRRKLERAGGSGGY